MCEQGKTPQIKINTKEKHYTVLAPKSLDGKPVMCCVIFTGKRINAMCETSLDLNVEAIGDVSDEDYFENNSGKGKMFPGGPMCHVRGVEVPCFCAWSNKGGITSDILTNILKIMDHLNLFPRTNVLRYTYLTAMVLDLRFHFLNISTHRSINGQPLLVYLMVLYSSKLAIHRNRMAILIRCQ